ncbi:MAG: hypothetical protein AAB759_02515 [Patescibacteria group bacterium]
MSFSRIIRRAVALAVLTALVLGLPDSGSAISFDTDLRSSSTGAYRLGLQPAEWRTINNIIHFYASSSVSIGSSHGAPAARLEVDGGVRLNTAATPPSCDATVRGILWYTQSASGVNDILRVCRQSAGAYDWLTVF